MTGCFVCDVVLLTNFGFWFEISDGISKIFFVVVQKTLCCSFAVTFSFAFSVCLCENNLPTKKVAQ